MAAWLMLGAVLMFVVATGAINGAIGYRREHHAMRARINAYGRKVQP